MSMLGGTKVTIVDANGRYNRGWTARHAAFAARLGACSHRRDASTQEIGLVADSSAPLYAGDENKHDSGAFIAADVGGTFARLALASGQDGGQEVVGQRRYACAEFPSLAAVLCQFAQELEAEGLARAPKAAVIAIAGVLQGDTLLNSNLPWSVSLERTRAEAGLDDLQLINDFQALAWALPQLSTQQMTPLHHDRSAEVRLPALLLGAGTGLGAALLVADGAGFRVLPSEAGHAALGAGNALELELLRGLQGQFSHVDNERILSGNGLVRLYVALCEQHAQVPRCKTPAEVIAAADSGQDAVAAQCLEVFCGWLGSLTGDLAIVFCAETVYLAGGITGHVRHHLERGDFMRRFLDKGVLTPALEKVPVFCIEHGWLGIVGAAAWYRAQADRSVTSSTHANAC